MDNLEKEAERHIRKAEQTAEFLRTKLNDHALPDHKKNFIRRDIEALEFLLEYAKEALAQRGIRV